MILHVDERLATYAFLARLFNYPDRELAAALAHGEAERAAARVPDAAPPLRATAGLRELEIAYTDLFLNRLGGAPAPPYGSVYLDPEGQLLGESTRRVTAAYRAEGLSLDGSGEPADFLPTELEFLYYLVEEEKTALARRDLAAARAATARQHDFAHRYLHPWMPAFCRRIEADAAAHPLYRWGAGLLIAFCRHEAAWLEKSGHR